MPNRQTADELGAGVRGTRTERSINTDAYDTGTRRGGATGGGVVNAAGSNHRPMLRLDGYGFTPETGLARLPAPVLEGEPETVTVNGSPLCRTAMPPSSQPPTMWPTAPLPLKCLRPGPNGST